MAIKTVLIEDNALIRETLIPTMEELGGMQVIAVAETADEGIEVLAQHEDTWQLAVVDLFLKRGSGLTILRAYEARPANRLVVALTNYATKDIRQKCLELGANAVFDKSTELEAFFTYCSSFFTTGTSGKQS